MAYYNGIVSNFEQLRTALVDACVINGYAYQNNILSKNTVFLRILVNTNSIDFFGRTSETSAETPNAVRIGSFGGNVVQPSFTFPLNYEIYIFDQEVFLIVEYNIDCFQWLSFGKSKSLLSEGTGMYLSASLDSNPSMGTNGVSISSNGSVSSYSVCPAFNFLSGNSDPVNIPCNTFINHGLESTWKPQLNSGNTIGISYLTQILNRDPSAWSSEALLLPICIYTQRSSSKNSLVLELENARNVRINHFEPKQIITLGADRWKIYPWYRKNSNMPNGGNGLTHTGTFGWAIRYDGP